MTAYLIDPLIRRPSNGGEIIEITEQEDHASTHCHYLESVTAKRRLFNCHQLDEFLEFLYAEDIHGKHVLSLADATLGVMTSASLAVHAIGQRLAASRGLLNKHAVVHVDRLLSNRGIDVWEYFAQWVPWVIGERAEVLVALDWTDLDHDGHTTLALLPLLVAASEALGYDRWRKANTSKKRTHSLLRQGQMLYDAIANMPEHRLRPLMEKFAELVLAQRVFTQVFGLL